MAQHISGTDWWDPGVIKVLPHNKWGQWEKDGIASAKHALTRYFSLEVFTLAFLKEKNRVSRLIPEKQSVADAARTNIVLEATAAGAKAAELLEVIHTRLGISVQDGTGDNDSELAPGASPWTMSENVEYVQFNQNASAVIRAFGAIAANPEPGPAHN